MQDLHLRVEFTALAFTEKASALDWCEIFLALQSTYEAVCDGLDVERHNIWVSDIKHPNASLCLQGLGEPIRALKEILIAFPEILVSLWTIPHRIKEKRREIDVRIEYLDIIAEAVRAYKKGGNDTEALSEVLRFGVGGIQPQITIGGKATVTVEPEQTYAGVAAK